MYAGSTKNLEIHPCVVGGAALSSTSSGVGFFERSFSKLFEAGLVGVKQPLGLGRIFSVKKTRIRQSKDGGQHKLVLDVHLFCLKKKWSEKKSSLCK